MKDLLEPSRRQFLQVAWASAGSAALTACGGGSDAFADAPNDIRTAGSPPPVTAPTPSPSPTPSPAPVPSPPQSTFAWQIAPDQPILLPAGTSTVVATGAVGMTVQVSPDLPPGRTLSVSNTGEVSIVSGSNAPGVDIRRPWVIDVMDSPIATIINVTKGVTYPPADGNWNTVMAAASHGDVIHISPGAVHKSPADMSNYFNGLDTCMLAIWKGLTIRNIPGRGRWRLYNGTDLMLGGKSGIVIFEPAAIEGRYPFVVEGFEYDNWGQNGDSNGFKIRQNDPKRSWSDFHPSLTVRNFKIGRPPYYRSASGFAGAAEVAIFEDGHVYDTGDGLGAAAGNDHNFYFSAKDLYIRGVRAVRSRSSNALGTSTMDGHIMKLSAENGWIEGCVIDNDPTPEGTSHGDATHLIQMKAGGNFVIRGCLIRDSINNQSQGRGSINMCREQNGNGNANFDLWSAGAQGNSLLIERNVFINHYGRSLLWFFPSGHPFYMAPGQAANQVNSVVVRDNIGMVAGSPTISAPFDDSKWVMNDPTGGAPWATNNSSMPYGRDEPGFDQKALHVYSRTAGALAAQAGTASSLRFQFPHGYVARSDAYQGLG